MDEKQITIRTVDLKQALASNLKALERIVTSNPKDFNTHTCEFILEQATLTAKYHPDNHCAITLQGFSTAKLGQQHSDAEALALLIQAAAMNNPWALFGAAMLYDTARGCKANPSMAAKFYRKALALSNNNEVIQQRFQKLLDKLDNNDNSYAEVRYHYYIHMENIEQLKANKHSGDCIYFLYCDPAPKLTTELKYQYAKQILQLKKIDIAKTTNHKYLFAWGMLFAIKGEHKLSKYATDKAEKYLNLANACLEQLEQIDHCRINYLLLREKILIILARHKQLSVNLDDAEQMAATVTELLAFTITPECYYLLADLIMRFNTQDIFINHKDKYRLIISLLSKVPAIDHQHCPLYDMLLTQAIANLNGSYSKLTLNTQNDILYLNFARLTDLICGPGSGMMVQYNPQIERQLLTRDDSSELLLAEFNTDNVMTFEQLIYKSYAPSEKGFDVAFCCNRLLEQFVNFIQQQLTPSEEDEIKIDHGLCGIIRKREIAIQDPVAGQSQHVREMLKTAIERAINTFKTQHNHNGFFSIASIQCLKTANQLLTNCTNQSNIQEILGHIATFLLTDIGQFDNRAFKYHLLYNIANALNLGTLKQLKRNPNQFAQQLGEILQWQSQQRTSNKQVTHTTQQKSTPGKLFLLTQLLLQDFDDHTADDNNNNNNSNN